MASSKTTWSEREVAFVRSALDFWWLERATHLTSGVTKDQVVALLDEARRRLVVVTHLRNLSLLYGDRAKDYAVAANQARKAKGRGSRSSAAARRFEWLAVENQDSCALAAALAERIEAGDFPDELLTHVPGGMRS